MSMDSPYCVPFLKIHPGTITMRSDRTFLFISTEIVIGVVIFPAHWMPRHPPICRIFRCPAVVLFGVVRPERSNFRCRIQCWPKRGVGAVNATRKQQFPNVQNRYLAEAAPQCSKCAWAMHVRPPNKSGVSRPRS